MFRMVYIPEGLLIPAQPSPFSLEGVWVNLLELVQQSRVRVRRPDQQPRAVAQQGVVDVLPTFNAPFE